MEEIVIISETYAQSLVGIEYKENHYYNPVQLPDGRWFISEIEAEFIDENQIITITQYNFTNTD